MKRLVPLLLTLCLLCACQPSTSAPEASIPLAAAPTATPEPKRDTFLQAADGRIIAPDGTEYVWFAMEGELTTLDYPGNFLAPFDGEPTYLQHLLSDTKTGMYAVDGDLEQNVLRRVFPYSEWCAFYRKASLPPLELIPENCSRFELIENRYPEDASHFTCNGGISDPAEVAAFWADISGQPTDEEAGFRSLIGGPGQPKYASRNASLYGFFAEEPYIAISFSVREYTATTHTIDLPDSTTRVLPERWLAALSES